MGGQTPVYGLRYHELNDPPDGADVGQDLAFDTENQLIRIENRINVNQNDIATLNATVTSLSTTSPRGYVGDALNAGASPAITADTIIDSVLNKTIGANRRIKLTWNMLYSQTPSPPFPSMGVRFQLGATIAIGTSTIIRELSVDSSGVNRELTLTAVQNITTAGAYSFASYGRGNGGTLNTTNRYLLIEDIGSL